jgi:hypothetical protein
MPVRLSACFNSAHARRISVTFYIGGVLEKSVENIQLWLKSNKNKRHTTWRPAYILITLVTDVTIVGVDSVREQPILICFIFHAICMM